MVQLKHPNILGCLGGYIDFGKKSPEFVLLAPLMAGGSLREVIQQDPEKARDKWLSLILGMGRGLAYLHRKRMVHFDFKSPNVLLESAKNWTPKICDFGLAKMRHASPVGSISSKNRSC